MPDQFLVTGAAGWLGQRLVDVLVNGLPDDDRFRSPPASRKVRALILPDQDPAPLKSLSPNVEVIQGDVRIEADCHRFCSGAEGAVLLHTAGIIHPRKVREFYDINVEGTKNLLKAGVQAKVRRGVVVSSNSPIGCNPDRQHRFDERSPYNPYMHYGRSKMVMEKAVHDIQREGQIETVIIRAPWFYGPYQPPRQTLFFTMIRDGKAPIVGDGNNVRSMAYIDNLCQGLILAGTHLAAAGQTYWIADERPYTMNEIVDTVERLLETEFSIPCKHKRLRLPNLASGIAYYVDKSLQGLGLYHQKFHVLSEMNKNIACVVDKATRELDYRPAIALEEGMRRSLKWCLERKLLA